jgi:uncharacterized protein (TIGR02246 family)
MHPVIKMGCSAPGDKETAMSIEQAAVEGFFDRFTHSWGTEGGIALGEYFTEDGTLVNPFGERAEGRKAVAAMYGEYFGSILRGTTTTVKLDVVRPVGSDHAFIDGEQTIMGPEGETIMAVHLSALLRQESDGWRFVDSRPYTVAAMPA